MAETLLSPGVLTRENDQSLVTQGPVVAGLAVLGPTVKGPVNVPTVVTSYSDYVNKFGGSFTSASIKYEYLTNISINNYFQQGGETAVVTRIVSASYAPASTEVRAITARRATMKRPLILIYCVVCILKLKGSSQKVELSQQG